ncbi:MAG: flagellar motor switch protein FliN [SAR324 cluster bacterium]|nr:flagellar motor switch protein FliN [SAR324 cluster bacterium]
MADDDFESFDNLDDLDWSDVEEDLKKNREQILSAASDEPQDFDMSSIASSVGDDDDSDGDAVDGNLDIKYLLDVELKISVEVGRTKILINHLLKLDTGNVVELQSAIGDPLDIRVNDKLVARGEVVVINEKFGVRITEIVNPDDRFSVFQ